MNPRTTLPAVLALALLVALPILATAQYPGVPTPMPATPTPTSPTPTPSTPPPSPTPTPAPAAPVNQTPQTNNGTVLSNATQTNATQNTTTNNTAAQQGTPYVPAAPPHEFILSGENQFRIGILVILGIPILWYFRGRIKRFFLNQKLVRWVFRLKDEDPNPVIDEKHAELAKQLDVPKKVACEECGHETTGLCRGCRLVTPNMNMTKLLVEFYEDPHWLRDIMRRFVWAMQPESAEASLRRYVFQTRDAKQVLVVQAKLYTVEEYKKQPKTKYLDFSPPPDTKKSPPGGKANGKGQKQPLQVEVTTGTNGNGNGNGHGGHTPTPPATLEGDDLTEPTDGGFADDDFEAPPPPPDDLPAPPSMPSGGMSVPPPGPRGNSNQAHAELAPDPVLNEPQEDNPLPEPEEDAWQPPRGQGLFRPLPTPADDPEMNETHATREDHGGH